MAYVSVPGMRSMISDGMDGLTINIPSQRHVVAMIFMVLWLTGWAVGLFFAVGMLLTGSLKDSFGKYFLIAWVIGWSAGGLLAIYQLLWMAFGKEIITLGRGYLVIKRDIKGFGRSREYDLTHVKNLRIYRGRSETYDSYKSTNSGGFGRGIIAFDYGAKTFRFGSSIDEAEAEIIISKLKNRYNFE